MTIIATVVKSTDDNLERLVSSSEMTHVECSGKITAEWEDHKELGKRLVLTCQKCRIKDKLAVNLNGIFHPYENTALTNLLSGRQPRVELLSEDSSGSYFHRGLIIWREGGREEAKIKKDEEDKESRERAERAAKEERKSTRNWLIGIAIFIIFIVVFWWFFK